MGEDADEPNATDEKLGRGPYRAAKPLSELIPPDRRWVRALAAGVLGALLGALVYHSASIIRGAARGGVEVASRIHSVTLSGPDGTVTLPMDRPAVVVNVWVDARQDVGKAWSSLAGLAGLDDGTPIVDVLSFGIDAPLAKANGAGPFTVQDDTGEYGVVRQLGITRFTTIVLDEQGVVRLVDYPGVPGFADRVIGAVRALSPGKAYPITLPSESRTSTDDPLHGHFTLEDATRDIHGQGALVATLETSKGVLQCKLYDDKAPNTVANFVGLATGRRTWKDPTTNEWTNRPAYDGTTFHRVIKNFMIQGGDPKGNGTGEPGYTIADEMWEGGKHDRAGLLCMANRGPNTNGAQFFITETDGPSVTSLDRYHSYGIFGECSPLEVIHAIAATPTGPQDRPLDPVVINRVRVARRP